MDRLHSRTLADWLGNPNRKPLVIRGPRQVGKTWLVRDFAKRAGLELIELNFEKHPERGDLFASNDPKVILKQLEAELARSIHPEATLLFLDEIQARPELIAKLRWFKEDMPQWPVIATGSLLEFVLCEPSFSMPVGRIQYLHLEPMTFFEFLLAVGQEKLLESLQYCNFERPLNPRLHDKALAFLLEYLLVGGLPDVVQTWIDTRDTGACQQVQKDLLTTYREDFNKYGQAPPLLIQKVFHSIAEQLGSKFVATRVEEGTSSTRVRQILGLLSMARITSLVNLSSATGLPLGACSNEKFFKALFLDVGLVSAQLGLGRIGPESFGDILFANKGGLAEQLAGQLLKGARSMTEALDLSYWQRTNGRQGEIDFLIQSGHRIVPIEVKAGKSGSMKSLHQFMHEKQLDLAVRMDQSPLALQSMDVKTTLGNGVRYDLLSIPLYLAERVWELTTPRVMG